ncbi:hypothetical protein [Rhodopseudomonas sp. B29]|uniref:hypothetical protein n=1 Tax=Rhodopseudomonas sp. B29 TaxID=95607 RepID=UPI00034D8E8F|nr:hypothetical protein [Rhodopseudomonas sp. B29]
MIERGRYLALVFTLMFSVALTLIGTALRDAAARRDAAVLGAAITAAQVTQCAKAARAPAGEARP